MAISPFCANDGILSDKSHQGVSNRKHHSLVNTLDSEL
jgi:hypothetical protein